jgi:peptidyl-tRNA hydrolase
VYVVVRADLSLDQQAVQACHAAFDAGSRFGRPSEDEPPANLVLLRVRNQDELFALHLRLEHAGVPTAMFFEEDDDAGATAFATAPLPGDRRSFFRKLLMWTASS